MPFGFFKGAHLGGLSLVLRKRGGDMGVHGCYWGGGGVEGLVFTILRSEIWLSQLRPTTFSLVGGR